MVVFETEFLEAVDFNGHIASKYLCKFLDISFCIGNSLFEVFLCNRIFSWRSSHLQFGEGNGYIAQLLGIYVEPPISHVSNIYSYNKLLSFLLHPGLFAYNKYYPVVHEEAVIFKRVLFETLIILTS